MNENNNSTQRYSTDTNAATSRYNTDQDLLNAREGRQATAQESAFERALRESLAKGQNDLQKYGYDTQAATSKYGTDQDLINAREGRSLTASENALTRQSNSQESALDRAFQQAQQDKTLGYNQKNIDQTRADYGSLIGRGQTDARSAEQQFMDETSKALPEVSALQESVRRNALPEQQEAMNQFRTTLNQNGVRGGQAATLLNRATGQLNRGLSQDVNQIALDEASKRQAARTGFLTNKAGTGQKAALSSPPSFG